MAIDGRTDGMGPEKMNLSLNGCGYLGIYHVGACSCIKKYSPQSLKGRISGGSVGALVACAFMCDVPLDTCAKYVFDVSMKVRNAILGPMTPDLNIMKMLYDSMDAMLPEDAHLHCDGRLHVSVTRFDSGQNVLLSNFKSREELLQALMCSCFIPIYCGYQPPEFYGVPYCDAALSNNSPWLDDYTITVAPFSGNSDICPKNDGLLLKSLKLSNTSIGINIKNMYMLFRVLFPASPEIQKDICQQGYNDALRYLRDNGLKTCENCVSTGPVPDHKFCEPPEERVPVLISNEIEKAIIGFQKNLGYRLFQYRSVKMLYYLNIPSIMTAKVTYSLISAVAQKFHLKGGLSFDDAWTNFLGALKKRLFDGYKPKLDPNQATRNAKLKILNDADVRLSDADRNGVTDKNNEESSQIVADVPVIGEPCQNTTYGLVNNKKNPSASVASVNGGHHQSIVVPRSEVPSDTGTSSKDTKIEVATSESIPNSYPSKSVSISMTSGQACQLELPHCNNNLDTQVNERMKTYVF